MFWVLCLCIASLKSHALGTVRTISAGQTGQLFLSSCKKSCLLGGKRKDCWATETIKMSRSK